MPYATSLVVICFCLWCMLYSRIYKYSLNSYITCKVIEAPSISWIIRNSACRHLEFMMSARMTSKAPLYLFYFPKRPVVRDISGTDKPKKKISMYIYNGWKFWKTKILKIVFFPCISHLVVPTRRRDAMLAFGHALFIWGRMRM